ncbi:MAG: hypothetical protein IT557_18450 [Alphaproteobacteria bacterium]|nr:hypothetical protein [Alphaproteobacteria bacterium]
MIEPAISVGAARLGGLGGLGTGRAGDWAGWGLGGLALRLPGIAENGAQVPLTVTAKGALSAGRHVKAIHHFATRNPTPGIASYSFSPAS